MDGRSDGKIINKGKFARASW